MDGVDRRHFGSGWELHTVDGIFCFLDFRLDLCFETLDFVVFGGKMDDQMRERKWESEVDRYKVVGLKGVKQTKEQDRVGDKKKEGKKKVLKLMNW